MEEDYIVIDNWGKLRGDEKKWFESFGSRFGLCNFFDYVVGYRSVLRKSGSDEKFVSFRFACWVGKDIDEALRLEKPDSNYLVALNKFLSFICSEVSFISDSKVGVIEIRMLPIGSWKEELETKMGLLVL